MSEKAVRRRLEQVDQLRELGLALLKAKKSSDKNARANEESNLIKMNIKPENPA